MNLLKMNELCTRKRMTITVLSLIGTTVMVLMIENFASSKMFGLPMEGHKDNVSKQCSKDQNTCRLCTSSEMKNEPQCWPTGFIKDLNCSRDQETRGSFISCPRFGAKTFWLFECIMVLFGISSYGVVVMRQNRLNRLLVEKVNRQITAGI